MYEGHAHAGRPVGSLKQLSHQAWSKMASIKAVVGVSPDSFAVLKYITIYTIQMCCTGAPAFTAAFNFIRITLEVGVLDITDHAFHSS